MPFHVGLLLVLAIGIQLVIAAREGFDPVDDSLQIASAATLVALVVEVTRRRRRRQKELILRILDELGQPLTVFRGYLSMLADGTLRNFDGKVELLLAQCDKMQQITQRLVEAVRKP
jgi:signal transduction histidine kinase